MQAEQYGYLTVWGGGGGGVVLLGIIVVRIICNRSNWRQFSSLLKVASTRILPVCSVSYLSTVFYWPL